MARLLLLVPTNSYRIGDFLKAARAIGTEVVVGCDRPPLQDDVFGTGTISLDFRDPTGAVAAIVREAKYAPFAAIHGVDEETGLVAARAAETLGLAHNDPEAVLAAADKHLFRQRLAEAGLPSPKFELASAQDDPAALAETMEYPCVLKPTNMSASRGVIRADNPEQFVAAFERVRAILAEEYGEDAPDKAWEILIEDFIPGAEVALEGLVCNGQLEILAIFDKPDPLEGPYFEETIYVTPSRMDAQTQAEIADMAALAVEALGLRDGPIHAEMRVAKTAQWVNETGPWMIELAPRSIGGLCARTLKFGTGLSLEELILRHAMGMPLESLERESAAAGVMMLPIPKHGILQGVNGAEEARAVPGIEDVTISIPIGHEVVPLPEGARYLGFIFARGDTPDAVENALRNSHAKLEFIITSL